MFFVEFILVNSTCFSEMTYQYIISLLMLWNLVVKGYPVSFM